MTKEEKINRLIDLWVELGIIELKDEPQPDSETDAAKQTQCKRIVSKLDKLGLVSHEKGGVCDE